MSTDARPSAVNHRLNTVSQAFKRTAALSGWHKPLPGLRSLCDEHSLRLVRHGYGIAIIATVLLMLWMVLTPSHSFSISQLRYVLMIFICFYLGYEATQPSSFRPGKY